MVKKASFIEQIEKTAFEIVSENSNVASVYELAKKMESMKKFKVKDYDNASSYFLQKELDLYKQKEKSGKVIDKISIDTLETAKKLVEAIKEIRRENNRKINKVDTNILTASPFFVGGSRELKKQAKEKGYITFEQGGIRKLTYHNDLGQLLTYNDAKTLFALFALWEEQGNGEGVSFTEYQLLMKMNMVNGGNQYKILRDSLEKLRTTSVIFQEAYDIESGERLVIDRFPLIIADKFTIDKDTKGNVRSRTNEIQFTPFIYKSIQNGHYSLISLALFDEMEADASKAIYSMLTGIYNMDNNEEYLQEDGSYEIPLEIIFEQFKLERPKAENKRTIDNACKELKDIEIIEKYFFTKDSSKMLNLVIKPSQWLIDILSKTKNNVLTRTEQLQLPLEE